VVDALQESFQFLGFETRKVKNPKSGKLFARDVACSQERATSARTGCGSLTTRWRASLPVGEVVEEMNVSLRGWGHYFYFGNPQQAMMRLKSLRRATLRKWLMRRRRRRSGWDNTQYPTAKLYEENMASTVCRPAPCGPAKA